MEQEISVKEVLELQRQTLELLRQALELLPKVAAPPVFRLNDTVTVPSGYPQPWTPVQPGIGTAPAPNWPNGTIICHNNSNVSSTASMMGKCRE